MARIKVNNNPDNSNTDKKGSHNIEPGSNDLQRPRKHKPRNKNMYSRMCSTNAESFPNNIYIYMYTHTRPALYEYISVCTCICVHIHAYICTYTRTRILLCHLYCIPLFLCFSRHHFSRVGIRDTPPPSLNLKQHL